jgi:hypothetical protein
MVYCKLSIIIAAFVATFDGLSGKRLFNIFSNNGMVKTKNRTPMESLYSYNYIFLNCDMDESSFQYLRCIQHKIGQVLNCKEYKHKT